MFVSPESIELFCPFKRVRSSHYLADLGPNNKLCYKLAPLPVHLTLPVWAPPRPATQIQSITDESRSSIRRKNQGGTENSNASRQSSTAEDTQEDEVVGFCLHTAPNPPLDVRHTGSSSQSSFFGYSGHYQDQCLSVLLSGLRDGHLNPIFTTYQKNKR